MDIAVVIEGVSPLLQNRFTDEAQLAATAGSRSSISNDRVPALEQAEKKLYTAEDGSIVVPQPNLYRCFIDAGKFVKVGKSKVTTQKTSILSAAMQIDPLLIPVESDSGWKVDTRPVRIPATGGRILCHRPCFDHWQLRFRVDLDESIISRNLFREIVDIAGRQIGLGDYRPDCKGPYGRFKVTQWE